MSIINTFPTTIANGQVEDATVVMSLFAWIQSQTNGNACPATTGSAMLKGNGAGGTISATAGTDYVAPTNTGDVAITGNVTVTGKEIVSAPAPLPSGGVGTFAYRAAGTFGGGYSLIDGTYNIGMWSTGGVLNIGFGSSLGALTSKFNIDANGNVQSAGGIAAGGAVSGTTATLSGAVTASGYNGITSANVTTALGWQPVQQGGGASQGANKLYIGWGSPGGNARLQVDGTDFGTIWPLTAKYAVGSVDQSWQKPARVGGTNYTNNTGKAIQVHVVFGGGTGGGGYMTVGGTTLGAGSSNQGSTSVSVVVPDGVTYSATATIAGITDWAELR